MPSSQFRRLTGAVVTVLVLLLVLSIAFILARFPLEADGVATPESGATPDPLAAQVTLTAQADEAAQAAAAQAATAAAAGLMPTFTPTPEPAPVAEAPADAALTPPGAGFGVTLQATPTRRDGSAPAASAEPAGGTDEAPTPAEAPVPAATRDPAALPLPDPSAPPTATVTFLANPNDVQDVAFAGDALWAATQAGALRWDVQAASGTLAGLEAGLGSVRLSSVVNCPLANFGLVFGSDAGLQVFNENEGTWRQIVSGGAAIRHRDVSALACDEAQGLLVVGYGEHGIDIFRARQGRWYYTERSEQLAPQGVSALAVGSGGVVWVASRGALASVNGTRITDYTTNSPLTGEAITALAFDETGALWVTAGDRLYRYAQNTWEVFAADRVTGDFPSGPLADVQPAGSGRVWVAAANGAICRFDAELGTCSPFHAAPADDQAASLTSLAVSEDGLLAWGTTQAGSRALVRAQWVPLALQAGLPAANRIFATAADASGFLWVASAAGVQQTNPAHPESARLINANETGAPPAVRTLVASPRGGVWLGGLWASYFDGAAWTHFTQADGLAGDEVTAITEDAAGRVWFGSPVGLSIWTGAEFITLTGTDVLPDADIRALAADAAGVWIGSASGGLFRFVNNQLQVMTAENVGLPSNTVTALLPAADGTLYVGTSAGLAHLVDGVVQSVDAVPAQPVTALAASPDGSVWVATQGAGSWVQRDGAWQAVAAQGLVLPTTVRTLTIDLYGGAWLGADNGLVRVAPNAQ